jgi:eukaryotic-like serine/threonine-protein kinase
VQNYSRNWNRLSPLLDQALDLDPQARTRWLDSLPPEHSDLYEILRELFARSDLPTMKSFLQRLPELSQPLAAETISAGQIIGRYRLIQELGAGGMSTVWLAELADGSLQRRVALKLPRSAWFDPGLAARMLRERDILAALEHPNIARLYDAGVDAAARPYLALEYVDGAPLDTYIRERALTLRQSIELFLQIARAVAFAHARLIVHRDLKPSNILVTAAGEVRLLDFGIARLLEPDLAQGAHHTHIGGRALTPAYAAPEQFTGQHITVATDVYSLGVLLYELLTSVSPYALETNSSVTLTQAVLLNEPAAASSVAPRERARSLRGDLDHILAKALKKSPNERYATVDALVEDIERHLAGKPIAVRSGSRWYAVQKFARRNAVPLAASALVAFSVIAGLAVAIWQWQEASTQRAAAEDRLREAEATLHFTTAVLTEGIQKDETISLGALLSRSETIAKRLGRIDATTRNVATEFLASWYIAYGAYEKVERLLTRSIDAFPAGVSSPAKSRQICERAGAWHQLGRTSEAIAALTAEIEHARDDPAVAAYCLIRRAALARQTNDAKSALAFALEAQRRYDESGGDAAGSKAQVLGEIAYAYSLNGDADLAQDFYEQAMELFEARGQQEDASALALRNNWGLARLATGNPLQALQLFDQCIAIARGRSPTDAPPPYLIGNRATALQLLARYDEALTAFDQMLRIAERGNDAMFQVVALGGKAEVARAQGRFDDAQAFLDHAAEVLSAGNVSSKSTGALRLRRFQAYLWADRGRSQDASALFSQLMEDYARLDCCVDSRARILIGRAEGSLSEHQLDRASADAERALEFARAAQGHTPYSFVTGRAWLTIGQVRQAQNRPEEAKKAYASAVNHLSHTLGEQHPDTVRARTAVGDLHL